MHIDTGSPVSLLPESSWISMGKPRLSPSPCKLRSYTGNQLNILGEFRGRVTFNGSTQVMPVVVTRGSSVPLLGRDWLEVRRIDWRAIVNSIHGPDLPVRLHPYRDLFSPELGRVKSVRVKLHLKPTATPKFFRPRPVPYALHA